MKVLDAGKRARALSRLQRRCCTRRYVVKTCYEVKVTSPMIARRDNLSVPPKSRKTSQTIEQYVFCVEISDP